MSNRLQPLEEFIEKGLCEKFKQVFGIPLVLSNVSSKKAIRSKVNNGAPVKYPLAFAALTGLSMPSSPSYRASPLLRRGITGHSSTDHVQTFKASVIPVESSYEIKFVTNDFKQVKDFSKAWLMSHVGGYLKFSIEYGVVNVDVHINLDPQIQIPTRDGSPDALNEFEVIASLAVQGYMSKDQLQRQQAVTSVEVEGLLKDPDATIEDALAQTGSRGEVSVFHFKSEWPATEGPAAKGTPNAINSE